MQHKSAAKSRAGISGSADFGKEIANIIGISVSELLRDENDIRKTSVICPHCGKEIQIEVK